MKRLQHIAILMMLLVASCTTDEFIHNEDIHQQGDKIQLVARNASFTEYEVSSRATGDNKLTYDFIIFGSDSEGTCVYYNHCEDDIINIDRVSDFTGINQNILSSCDIYILVNYPGIYNKILADATSAGATDVVEYIKAEIVGKKKLEYFNHIPTDVEPFVNMEESALPRIGRYREKVDLRTSASIASGTIYPVDLQSLYAKIEFDINIDPIEENFDLGIPNTNTFQITGYTVHNLAKEVDLWSGEEGVTHDDIEVHPQAIEGVLGNDVPRTPVRSLSFTCYLPERFFKPKTSADEYEYPFGKGSSIREEDLDRRQRYKPLLGQGYKVNDINYAGATYVTISGVFTNHQGHTFDVVYDIYVGNDNYSNFDIVRNRHYINNITIRGIHHSTNQESSDVSIDHRVNISHTRPIYSNLRRETLLDAHYEVRPLRIKRNHSHSGDETHVKVEVSYENTNTDDKPADDKGNGNWIGLERSFGNGVSVNSSTLYCVGSGSSAGKRKYFTYDLVNKSFSKGSDTDDSAPLHTSTSVVVPIPEEEGANECVWIYVDECTEASAAKDAKRSATIRLTCGKYVNSEFTPVGEPIDYVINQHKLFEVSWKDRKYHIEHEEEYLHNFDSEDTYIDNKTEEEGMVWGLYNAQLSFDNQAFVYNAGSGTWNEIVNWLIKSFVLGNTSVYYDFYIPKHDNISNVEKFAYYGWNFCKDIIKDINTKNNSNRNTGYAGTIGTLSMDVLPTYAIEYAYNRNKRNRDGSVPDDYNKWYLPAIDEMEDIMMGGASYFDEFRNKFYWSCQPSYLVNYVTISGIGSGTGSYYADDTGIYYIEEDKTTTSNKGYARATKANYLGDDGNSATVDWEYAPSGASGYDDAIKAYSYLLYNDAEMQRSGKVGNITLNSIDRDDDPETEGNHERNTKHRVRCVYKSQYYDTNKNSTDY